MYNMVDDNVKIVQLVLPLIENNDERDMIDLFTLHKILNLKDEIVQEFINNELINSEWGDIHQTHIEYIDNASCEYDIEGNLDLAKDSM